MKLLLQVWLVMMVHNSLAFGTGAPHQDPNSAPPAGSVLHRIRLSSFVVKSHQSGVGRITRRLADGLIKPGDAVEIELDHQPSSPIVVGTRLVSFVIGPAIHHPGTHTRLGSVAQISATWVVEKVDQKIIVARVEQAMAEIEVGQRVTSERQIFASQATSSPKQTASPVGLWREVAPHWAQQHIFGVVVGTEDNVLVSGAQKLLFVDKGEADGLKVGDVIAIQTSVAGLRTSAQKTVASAVVVGVNSHLSACWVTLAHREISLGDTFATVTAAAPRR